MYFSGIKLFILFSYPFRFESDNRDKKQLPVRLISDRVLSHVEFRSSPDPDANNLLSRLNFRLSSMKLDHTVSTTHKSAAYPVFSLFVRPFTALYIGNPGSLFVSRIGFVTFPTVKTKETIFPETSCDINDNNSPHGKFHRFSFPFSSKFPDLNFTPYVLYIYSCHETST